MHYPNEWYLDGIKAQKPEVLRQVFASFLPQLAAVLRPLGADNESIKDVFMYAVEVVYRKIIDSNLILTANFGTFLIEVAKRKWLKDQRRKKFDAGVTTDHPSVLNLTSTTDDLPFERTERYLLLLEKFKSLGQDCQKVLHLSWHTDRSMEEVAAEMNWTYGFARKRKSECRKILENSIISDPRYAELRYN